MATTEPQAAGAPAYDEKTGYEHNSLESANKPSEIDLLNYYDDHPGSLVVDPECARPLSPRSAAY